jgi:hypothetical protein
MSEPKFTVIRLGDENYSVPHLNIDQLERVTGLFDEKGVGPAFKILRIAMERSTPRVDEVGAIEATPAEVQSAVSNILVLSGMKTPGEAGPKGAEAPA